MNMKKSIDNIINVSRSRRYLSRIASTQMRIYGVKEVNSLNDYRTTLLDPCVNSDLTQHFLIVRCSLSWGTSAVMVTL